MTVTKDDFDKIWASASPLTPYSFSASQYKEGWNFIGSTPPSRQMWDFLQKNNDEKMQYLLNHFDNYLPLSGGTLTGDVDITGDLSVSGAIYSSDPASGENSGQVPTTAWVQKLLADALKKAKLDAHPVGSYYWSNDSTSPATLFGGTWEALPPGYTLIAQGSGTDEYGSFTYTAGQKYGERKHQLTTDELPKFTPSAAEPIWNDGNGTEPGNTVSWKGHGILNILSLFSSIGKDKPHNNLPPSIAAYCWKRTA